MVVERDGDVLVGLKAGERGLHPGGFRVLGTNGETPSWSHIHEAAVLFGEVFAGHPWCEATRCGGCREFSGLGSQPGDGCGRCGVGVLDRAYPVGEVSSVIQEQLVKSSASVYLLDDRGIKGFAWGYPRSRAEMVGMVGGEFAVELDRVLREVEGGHPFLFSAAEVGVAESCRGRGWGKFLLGNLIEDGRKMGVPTTVWTRSDAVLTPICVKFGLAQVYGPRVILEDGVLHETGEVLIGRHKDTPQRVMFVREAGGQI